MNPPVVFPTDPHLLAQWRFDERRRGVPGAATLHRVAMVLGRFSDRVEIRNPAEAPEVSASARAIAAETDKAAYRAALTDAADRIDAHFGATPAPAAQHAPAADWLATLDARLAGGPSGGNDDAASPAPTTAPPAAGPDLPDFLAGDGWEAPSAAAASPVAELPLLTLDVAPGETVDDASYLPPAAHATSRDEDGAAPSSPADAPADVSDGGSEPWAPAALDAAPAAGPAETEPAPAVARRAPRDRTDAPPPAVRVLAIATPPADAPRPPAPDESSPEAAGTAAARLAELGRTLGLAVTGRAVAESTDGADPLAALDVVWRDGSEVTAAFLVDPPRPLGAALLELADLVAAGDAVPPLLVVAPAALRADLRREASRPAFARLPVPLAAACGFVAHEALDAALERAADFLPYLRPGFVHALAERLDS